jgi:hypothetical protein
VVMMMMMMMVGNLQIGMTSDESERGHVWENNLEDWPDYRVVDISMFTFRIIFRITELLLFHVILGWPVRRTVRW